MRWAFALTALCLAAASALPARAQNAGHFIEFRARPGALWGHTFVVYGDLDRQGRAIERRRVGLYPDDGRAGLIAGTFVPVAATVQAVPDDFSMRPSAIYRVRLNAADYARVTAKIERMRRGERAWHMLMFNCNDFGIAIAHELGLVAPPNVLVPNAWVRALAAMNGG